MVLGFIIQYIIAKSSVLEKNQHSNANICLQTKTHEWMSIV